MTGLKRFLLLAASGSAIVFFVYPAVLSAADGKPTRIAISDARRVRPLPRGARVHLRVRRGARVEQPVPHDVPGGRERQTSRMSVIGVLKERVTNVGTGKSIILNISGPSTEIVHPDQTADLTLDGSVMVSYNARFNPRGPATYVYTGHTVLSISDDGVLTLVSTTDKQPFDVCAALS